MQKELEKTTQISARIPRSLHIQLCRRADSEGKTFTQIQQESLLSYLSGRTLNEQLEVLERGMLIKIFAVVCAVANLSNEERRNAKSALKTILAAEGRQ